MSRGRKARPAGGLARGAPPRGATHPGVAGRAAILAAILVVAGVLAYGSGLSSPFLFDDQNAIVTRKDAHITADPGNDINISLNAADDFGDFFGSAVALAPIRYFTARGDLGAL